MTTDEHDDGEVHGLLATAFDGDVPLVDLVPATVDGYRKHRRRARTLGTIGGALALAGVAVAGTALGAGSGHRTQSAGTEPGTVAVPPKIAAKCTGTYNLLGNYQGTGVYSADQPGLTAVCAQDLATLQQLTGDTSLGPLGESLPRSGPPSEPTAEMTPQIGGSGATLQPGDYLGRSSSGAYIVSIMVFDRTPSLGTNCTTTSCPPNLKLADGRAATKATGLRDSFVVIRYDATHSIVVRAGLEDRNSEEPLPFDFDKLIASPAFARLINYDVHALDQLTRPA